MSKNLHKKQASQDKEFLANADHLEQKEPVKASRTFEPPPIQFKTDNPLGYAGGGDIEESDLKKQAASGNSPGGGAAGAVPPNPNNNNNKKKEGYSAKGSATSDMGSPTTPKKGAQKGQKKKDKKKDPYKLNQKKKKKKDKKKKKKKVEKKLPFKLKGKKSKKGNRAPAEQFKPKASAKPKNKKKVKAFSPPDRLPTDVQDNMSSLFGEDFKTVKILQNSQKAKDLKAQAFTQGDTIHFAPGKYQPKTKKGMELIGHELTHIVQQRDGKVEATGDMAGNVFNDDKGLEKEADEMGKKAAAGNFTRKVGGKDRKGKTDDVIQRKAEVEEGEVDGANPDMIEGDQSNESEDTGAKKLKGQDDKKEEKDKNQEKGSPDSEGMGDPTPPPYEEGAPAEPPETADLPDKEDNEFAGQISGDVISGADSQNDYNARFDELYSELSMLIGDDVQFAQVEVDKDELPIPDDQEEKKEEVKDELEYNSANDKKAAERKANRFIFNATDDTKKITKDAKEIPAQIGEARAQAAGMISGAMGTQKGAITSAFAGFKSTVVSETASAIGQIESQHASTVAAIESTYAGNVAKVQSAYSSSVEQINSALSAHLSWIESAYNSAAAKIKAIGQESAAEAIKIANAKAAEYRSRGGGGFFSSKKKKNKARAQAAESVGKSYAESFIKEANAQAEALLKGKEPAKQQARAIAEGQLAALEAQYNGALQGLEAAKISGIAQADAGKVQFTQTVQQLSDGTLQSLNAQESMQLESIDKMGNQKIASLASIANESASSLQKGVVESVEQLRDEFIQFKEETDGSIPPEEEAFESNVRQVEDRITNTIERVEKMMVDGVANAKKGLISTASQTVGQLADVAQTGIGGGQEAVASFNSGTQSALASASQAFEQFKSMHKQQSDAATSQALSGFSETVSSTLQQFADNKSRIQSEMDSAVSGFESAMNDSLNNKLPADIEKHAEEAASKVKGGFLSMLIMIVIVVVVSVFLTPAVGLMVGGALGGGLAATIVTAAITGAITSGLQTMANNLLTGQGLFDGVGKAMLSGAATSALTAGLGPALGKLDGLKSLASGASPFVQKLASYGVDFLKNTTADVLMAAAKGDPINLGAIAKANAMSAVVDLASSSLDGFFANMATSVDKMNDGIMKNLAGYALDFGKGVATDIVKSAASGEDIDFGSILKSNALGVANKAVGDGLQFLKGKVGQIDNKALQFIAEKGVGILENVSGNVLGALARGEDVDFGQILKGAVIGAAKDIGQDGFAMLKDHVGKMDDGLLKTVLGQGVEFGSSVTNDILGSIARGEDVDLGNILKTQALVSAQALTPALFSKLSEQVDKLDDSALKYFLDKGIKFGESASTDILGALASGGDVDYGAILQMHALAAGKEMANDGLGLLKGQLDKMEPGMAKLMLGHGLDFINGSTNDIFDGLISGNGVDLSGILKGNGIAALQKMSPDLFKELNGRIANMDSGALKFMAEQASGFAEGSTNDILSQLANGQNVDFGSIFKKNGIDQLQEVTPELFGAIRGKVDGMDDGLLKLLAGSTTDLAEGSLNDVLSAMSSGDSINFGDILKANALNEASDLSPELFGFLNNKVSGMDDGAAKYLLGHGLNFAEGSSNDILAALQQGDNVDLGSIFKSNGAGTLLDMSPDLFNKLRSNVDKMDDGAVKYLLGHGLNFSENASTDILTAVQNGDAADFRAILKDRGIEELQSMSPDLFKYVNSKIDQVDSKQLKYLLERGSSFAEGVANDSLTDLKNDNLDLQEVLKSNGKEELSVIGDDLKEWGKGKLKDWAQKGKDWLGGLLNKGKGLLGSIFGKGKELITKGKGLFADGGEVDEIEKWIALGGPSEQAQGKGNPNINAPGINDGMYHFLQKGISEGRKLSDSLFGKLNEQVGGMDDGFLKSLYSEGSNFTQSSMNDVMDRIEVGDEIKFGEIVKNNGLNAAENLTPATFDFLEGKVGEMEGGPLRSALEKTLPVGENSIKDVLSGIKSGDGVDLTSILTRNGAAGLEGAAPVLFDALNEKIDTVDSSALRYVLQNASEFGEGTITDVLGQVKDGQQVDLGATATRHGKAQANNIGNDALDWGEGQGNNLLDWGEQQGNDLISWGKDKTQGLLGDGKGQDILDKVFDSSTDLIGSAKSKGQELITSMKEQGSDALNSLLVSPINTGDTNEDPFAALGMEPLTFAKQLAGDNNLIENVAPLAFAFNDVLDNSQLGSPFLEANGFSYSDQESFIAETMYRGESLKSYDSPLIQELGNSANDLITDDAVWNTHFKALDKSASDQGLSSLEKYTAFAELVSNDSIDDDIWVNNNDTDGADFIGQTEYVSVNNQVTRVESMFGEGLSFSAIASENGTAQQDTTILEKIGDLPQEIQENVKGGFRYLLGTEGVSVNPNEEFTTKDIGLEYYAHAMAYQSPEEIFANPNHRTIVENLGGDLSQMDYTHGTEYSFDAIIVPGKDEDTNAVLAIRGSQELMDWVTDADFKQPGNEQFKRNISEIERLLDTVDGKVDITGHSLGGALSQMIAVNYPDKIASLTTFQSPGIAQKEVNKYNALPEDQQFPVTHHFANDDVVDKGGEQHIPGTFYDHFLKEGIGPMSHTSYVFGTDTFTEMREEIGFTNDILSEMGIPVIEGDPGVDRYDVHPEPFVQDTTEAVRKVLVGVPKETTEGAVEGTGWLFNKGKELFEGAKDWTGDRIDDAKDWTGDRIDDGKYLYEAGKDWTGDRIDDGKNWTNDRIEDGKYLYEGAKDWTEDRIEQGRGLYNDASDWTGDKIEQGRQIKDAIFEAFKNETKPNIPVGEGFGSRPEAGDGFELPHYFGEMTDSSIEAGGKLFGAQSGDSFFDILGGQFNAGNWQNEDGSNWGLEANGSVAKGEFNYPELINGVLGREVIPSEIVANLEAQGPFFDAHGTFNKDTGVSVGAEAGLAEAAVEFGTSNPNSVVDRTLGLEAGLKASGGGLAAHWADSDNDGYREYGLGVDLPVLPVGIDIKTEDPVRDAIPFGLGNFIPNNINLTGETTDAAVVAGNAIHEKGTDLVDKGQSLFNFGANFFRDTPALDPIEYGQDPDLKGYPANRDSIQYSLFGDINNKVTTPTGFEVNNPIFDEALMKNELTGSRIQGAGNSDLERAMYTLYSNPQGTDLTNALDTVADVRGIDPTDMARQYNLAMDIRQTGRDYSMEQYENKVNALPVNEQADYRANSPYHDVSPDLNLYQHPEFTGSTGQLRFGKVLGDVFGIDPVFGSLISPTGGAVGPGNESVSDADADNAIVLHGTVHDGAGYLNNAHGVGPGYNYLRRPWELPTDDPLSGQLSGPAYWGDRNAAQQLAATLLSAPGNIPEHGLTQDTIINSGVDVGDENLAAKIADGDLKGIAGDAYNGVIEQSYEEIIETEEAVRGFGGSIKDGFNGAVNWGRGLFGGSNDNTGDPLANLGSNDNTGDPIVAPGPINPQTREQNAEAISESETRISELEAERRDAGLFSADNFRLTMEITLEQQTLHQLEGVYSYQDYIGHFNRLEQAAVNEGYTQGEVVSAIRQIYYPNGSEAGDYAGVTTGGGAWNILIQGAQDVEIPTSWQTEEFQNSVEYLDSNQVVQINGEDVDMGHVFAGLDARQHPDEISLFGLVNMNNHAASTNGGDMGSVVGEYIMNSDESFYETARGDMEELNGHFRQNFSDADMRGNIDSYTMEIDPNASLVDNLNSYYQDAGENGSRFRYTNFAEQMNLFNEDGSVNQDVRNEFVSEAFNGAQAYVASQGRRSDVLAIQSDPGPGMRTDLPVLGDIGTPTFWEMYYNSSEATTDMFVDMIQDRAAAEQIAPQPQSSGSTMQPGMSPYGPYADEYRFPGNTEDSEFLPGPFGFDFGQNENSNPPIVSEDTDFTYGDPGGVLYVDESGNTVVENPATNDAINLNDVDQGSLGDCYFLAAIGAVADTNPEIIENMITDNGDGTYDVTLHTDSKWYSSDRIAETITVTSDVPLNEEGNPAYAAHGDGTEMWVGLIEKAYAQHHGGYENIEGGVTELVDERGNPGISMEIITGGQTTTYDPRSMTDDQVLDQLEAGLSNNVPMTASSDSFGSDKEKQELSGNAGIVGGHAYVIQGIDRENGTVSLYNPWGHSHQENLSISEFRAYYYRVQAVDITGEGIPSQVGVANDLVGNDSNGGGAVTDAISPEAELVSNIVTSLETSATSITGADRDSQDRDTAVISATAEFALAMSNLPPELQTQVIDQGSEHIATMVANMKHLNGDETKDAYANLAFAAESVGREGAEKMAEIIHPNLNVDGGEFYKAIESAAENGNGALLSFALAKEQLDNAKNRRDRSKANVIINYTERGINDARDNYLESQDEFHKRSGELSNLVSYWTEAGMGQDAISEMTNAYHEEHKEVFEEYDKVSAAFGTTLEGAGYALDTLSGKVDQKDMRESLFHSTGLMDTQGGQSTMVNALLSSGQGQRTWLDTVKDNKQTLDALAEKKADGKRHVPFSDLFDQALFSGADVGLTSMGASGNGEAVKSIVDGLANQVSSPNLANALREGKTEIDEIYKDWNNGAMANVQDLLGRLSGVFSKSPDVIGPLPDGVNRPARQRLNDRDNALMERLGASLSLGSSVVALANDPSASGLFSVGEGSVALYSKILQGGDIRTAAGEIDFKFNDSRASWSDLTRRGKAGLIGNGLASAASIAKLIEDPTKRNAIEAGLSVTGIGADVAGMLGMKGASKLLTKVGLVTTIAFSAWDTFTAIREGDWIGAAAAAAPLAGAAIGAALTSWSGPGAALGAAIGALVGFGIQIGRWIFTDSPAEKYEKSTDEALLAMFNFIGINGPAAENLAHRFRDVNADFVGVAPALGEIANERNIPIEDVLVEISQLDDHEMRWVAKALLDVDTNIDDVRDLQEKYNNKEINDPTSIPEFDVTGDLNRPIRMMEALGVDLTKVVPPPATPTTTTGPGSNSLNASGLATDANGPMYGPWLPADDTMFGPWLPQDNDYLGPWSPSGPLSNNLSPQQEIVPPYAPGYDPNSMSGGQNDWFNVQSDPFGLGGGYGADPKIPRGDRDTYSHQDIEGDLFVQGAGDANAASLNDIKQGQLGDCYYLAALGAVAQRDPEFIQNMITDNGDGTFDVTLHLKDGIFSKRKETTVTVDSSIPVDSNGNPAYAQFGDENEMWVMLAEKAYAQHHGGYGNIEGGWGGKAMEVLTGEKSTTNRTGWMTDQDIERELETAVNEGRPITAHSKMFFFGGEMKKTADEDGLVFNHLYVVEGFDKETGMVELYNPHGFNHQTLSIEEFRNYFKNFDVNNGVGGSESAAPTAPGLAATSTTDTISTPLEAAGITPEELIQTSLQSEVATPAAQSTEEPPLWVTLNELTILGEGNGSHIHWPATDASGVTLGIGYDIGSRSSASVINDLTSAGLDSGQAEAIAAGVGLKGIDARNFVRANRNLIGEIPLEVRAKLFETEKPRFLEEAKARATRTTPTGQNGLGINAIDRDHSGKYVLSEQQWEGLHPGMKELLTDMTYQGGYYGYDRVAKVNEALLNHDGDHLGQFNAVRMLFADGDGGSTDSYMDNYAGRIGERKIQTPMTEEFFDLNVNLNGEYRRNEIRGAFLDHIIAAMEEGREVKMGTPGVTPEATPNLPVEIRPGIPVQIEQAEPVVDNTPEPTAQPKVQEEVINQAETDFPSSPEIQESVAEHSGKSMIELDARVPEEFVKSSEFTPPINVSTLDDTIYITGGFMESKGHGNKSFTSYFIGEDDPQGVQSIGPGTYNIGIDYVLYGDTPEVGSWFNGEVIKSGDEGGYGNRVHVATDHQYNLNGTDYQIFTAYAHLDSINGSYEKGDQVNAGDSVGIMGNTGASRGAHVDLAVWIEVDGQKINLSPNVLHLATQKVSSPTTVTENEPVAAPVTEAPRPSSNGLNPLSITPSELTVLGEGNDSHIHWPNTEASGVTLGIGYDIGSRPKASVIQDLTEAGMSDTQAAAIANGVGLKGADARDFVRANKDTIGSIPLDVRAKLFENERPKYLEEARQRATRTSPTGQNGSGINAIDRDHSGSYVMTDTQWENLHPGMKELLTDMTYQGGYYGYDRVAKVNRALLDNDGNHTEQFKAVRQLFTDGADGSDSYMDNYAGRIGERKITQNWTEDFFGTTVALQGEYRRNEIRGAYLDHIIGALEEGRTVQFGTTTNSAKANDPNIPGMTGTANPEIVAEDATFTYATGSGILYVDDTGNTIINDPASSNAIKLNDVDQGSLADCYFLAAVGSLANTNPQLIEDMITDNGDGTFDVRLFVGGDPDNPQVQTVNADLPMRADGSTPAYAGYGDGQEMWVAVIEKAYAQQQGGYEGIEWGNTGDAMGVLTGDDHNTYQVNNMTEAELGEQLQQAIASNTPITADTRNNEAGSKKAISADGLGLVGNHTYVVQGYDEEAGTVQLYNPWGSETEITLSEFHEHYSRIQTLDVGSGQDGGGGFWNGVVDFFGGTGENHATGNGNGPPTLQEQVQQTEDRLLDASEVERRSIINPATGGTFTDVELAQAVNNAERRKYIDDSESLAAVVTINQHFKAFDNPDKSMWTGFDGKINREDFKELATGDYNRGHVEGVLRDSGVPETEIQATMNEIIFASRKMHNTNGLFDSVDKSGNTLGRSDDYVRSPDTKGYIMSETLELAKNSETMVPERLTIIDEQIKLANEGVYIHYGGTRPRDMSAILAGTSYLGELTSAEQRYLINSALNDYIANPDKKGASFIGATANSLKATGNSESIDIFTELLLERSLEVSGKSLEAGANGNAETAASSQRQAAIMSYYALSISDADDQVNFINSLNKNQAFQLVNALALDNTKGIGERTGHYASMDQAYSNSGRTRVANELLKNISHNEITTEASKVIVANAFNHITKSGYDRIDNLPENMANALALQAYPADKQARAEYGQQLRQVLDTDQGRELFAHNSKISPGVRQQMFQLFLEDPDRFIGKIKDAEDSAYENGDLLLDFAKPTIRDHMDRGDDYVKVPNENSLQNLIGSTMSIPVSNMGNMSQQEMEAMELAIANGTYDKSLYASDENAMKMIKPIMDSITDFAGDSDIQVTLVPIQYSSENSGPVDVPLYRVLDSNGVERFVDNKGGKYDSFEEWENENELPPGKVTYPENGHITPGTTSIKNRNTPKTRDTVGEYLLTALDWGALVGGTIAGGILIFGTGGLATPLVVGGASLVAGGAGIYGAGRSAGNLMTSADRGRSINPLDSWEAAGDWLGIAGGLLGAGTLTSASRLGQGAQLTKALGIGATLADFGGGVHDTGTLIKDWDKLTPEQRAMLAMKVAFYVGSEGASRYYANRQKGMTPDGGSNQTPEGSNQGGDNNTTPADLILEGGNNNKPETTDTPDTVNTPETTDTPDVVNAPETADSPELVNTPETVNAPEVVNGPETANTTEGSKTVTEDQVDAAWEQYQEVNPNGSFDKARVREELEAGRFLHPTTGRFRKTVREVDIDASYQQYQEVNPDGSFDRAKIQEELEAGKILNPETGRFIKITDDFYDFRIRSDKAFRNSADEFTAYNLWKKQDWPALEKFVQDRGLKSWPPNRGFITTTEITVQPGTIIDRFGGDNGNFVSPVRDANGELYPNRALPYAETSGLYSVFEVVKPIDGVMAGEAIPWFNNPGKAQQFEFPQNLSIKALLDGGYIKEIRRTGPIEGIPGADHSSYTPTQRAERIEVMKKWEDGDTGKPYRIHELEGAADFESATGLSLKANDPGVPGDFTGATNGVVYDHFGMPARAFQANPNAREMLIAQFKNSLTTHVNKLENGVDELIADLSNFTVAEKAAIKQYAVDNHPTLADKINYINE